MSSSAGIRGIRRKKSSLSEVKIAIIGAPGVGKSGESENDWPDTISKHRNLLTLQLWQSDF